jgi:peptidoglycan hydrolase CwlO-like protein
MDKSDLILDRLNIMEKALRAENKTLSDKIDKLENKVDRLSEKQDMSWQAIQEIREELTENSVKIKIIDNKVKAL